MSNTNVPRVAIILGSESDSDLFESSNAKAILTYMGIPTSLSIGSADHNPIELTEYCQESVSNGTQVFIAAAGLAAILPSAIAVNTGRLIPVIAVPLPGGTIFGENASLLTSLMKPSGAPLPVVGAFGKAGFNNAALLACQIIGLSHPIIQKRLGIFFRDWSESDKPFQDNIWTNKSELDSGEEL